MTISKGTLHNPGFFIIFVSGFVIFNSSSCSRGTLPNPVELFPYFPWNLFLIFCGFFNSFRFYLMGSVWISVEALCTSLENCFLILFPYFIPADSAFQVLSYWIWIFTTLNKKVHCPWIFNFRFSHIELSWCECSCPRTLSNIWWDPCELWISPTGTGLQSGQSNLQSDQSYQHQPQTGENGQILPKRSNNRWIRSHVEWLKWLDPSLHWKESLIWQRWKTNLAPKLILYIFMLFPSFNMN